MTICTPLTGNIALGHSITCLKGTNLHVILTQLQQLYNILSALIIFLTNILTLCLVLKTDTHSIYCLLLLHKYPSHTILQPNINEKKAMY